jgi:site-specific DNA-methyltransferase (adenine-specific)
LGNDELKTDYRLSKGTSQWEGWGTALKPAHEPIVMARKPLSEKTVGNNVLEWGTGGINIDGCRVETDDNLGGGATNGSVLSVEGFDRPWMHDEKKMKEFSDKMKEKVEHAQTLGRFPANIIFDEEAGKLLDEQTGVLSNAGSPKKTDSSKTSIFGAGLPGKIYSDVGGASRFFYCPKTSKSDRNEGLDDFEKKVTMRDDGQPYGMNTNQFRPDGSERKPVEPKSNHHPTVKPTDLMAYLIRLVTPKGGIVLDPFMGSGSTGKAAVREGMEFIGIERENEYFEIAKSRIEYETNKPTSKTSKTKKVEVETKVEEKVNQFFG